MSPPLSHLTRRSSYCTGAQTSLPLSRFASKQKHAEEMATDLCHLNYNSVERENVWAIKVLFLVQLNINEATPCAL